MLSRLRRTAERRVGGLVFGSRRWVEGHLREVAADLDGGRVLAAPEIVLCAERTLFASSQHTERFRPLDQPGPLRRRRPYAAPELKGA